MSLFSEKVHNVVKGIKPGHMKTYKDVAIAAGNPNAARAVANLMAKNFDPAIPCHRVIRSDGSLGGYNRGGTEVKKRILQDEGVSL